MRRVTFTYSYHDGNGMTQKQGKGMFHAWGYEALEVGDTICSATVGIVEEDDGAIRLVAAERIKFDVPYIDTNTIKS